MKGIYFFILFTICVSLCGCFISDRLIDDFRKINASLEKSNQLIRLKNGEAMYIILKRSNNAAYLQADSLFKLNNDAFDYIDSLKKQMLIYDPKGDNINIPKEFLVHTFNGLMLQQKLGDVYNYVHTILPDSSKIPLPDTIGMNLKSTTTDTAWARKNFRSVPTMTAITSLTKYQNDCLVLEEQALMLLRKDVKK